MDTTESMMVEIHSLQGEIAFLHQKIETIQLDNYDSRLTLMEIELSKKTVALEELEEKYVQALSKQNVLSKEKSLLETKEKYMLIEYQTKLKELQEWCENLKKENRELKNGKKPEKKQKLIGKENQTKVLEEQKTGLEQQKRVVPKEIKTQEISTAPEKKPETNPFLGTTIPKNDSQPKQTNPFLDPIISNTNPFIDVPQPQKQTNPFLDPSTTTKETNPFLDPTIEAQLVKKEKETNPFLDETLLAQVEKVQPNPFLVEQTNENSPKKEQNEKQAKESKQLNVVIHSPSTNEQKEKIPEKKPLKIEKPTIEIKNEFEEFGVEESSSSESEVVFVKSSQVQSKEIGEMKKINEQLLNENELLKQRLTESEKKNIETNTIMQRNIEDKTKIIQSLQDNIVSLENDLKQTNFKLKQLQSKIEEYNRASSDEVEENNRYLLVNGICVALKMGNPDYERTRLNVTELYDKVKNQKVPMCQWPLFISSAFENELNGGNDDGIV